MWRERGASRCKLARAKRGTGDRQCAFELAGNFAGKLLHPGKPLTRAVAEPQIGVTLREIWVRIDRPRGFQNFSRLARVAGLRESPTCQRRRRYQIRCELDRLEHQCACRVAISVLKRLR